MFTHTTKNNLRLLVASMLLLNELNVTIDFTCQHSQCKSKFSNLLMDIIYNRVQKLTTNGTQKFVKLRITTYQHFRQ